MTLDGIGVHEILEWLKAGGVLGLLALAGKLYVDNRRLRISAKANDQKAGLDLEKHRDHLTFELLEAARADVAALRLEVERLRPSEAHLIHFETALQHVERLLLAASDPIERKRAERAARAFLNRMRRMQTARGTIANEAQRLESGVSLVERKGIGNDE